MSITALFFISFYILGLVLAFLKRPIYGLYTYIFTFYLHAPGQWWGEGLPSFRWSFAAGILTLIAILADKSIKKNDLLKYPETKLFLIFVAFNMLQYFWAIDRTIHFEFIVLSIKFLVLFFIIQKSISNLEDVQGFMLANLVGCAYIGYRGYGGGRLEGMGIPGLDGSNLLSQHLAVVLVFSGFLFLCHSPLKIKVLMLPLILLTLNGIILAESRSVIISLAASGLFMIIFSPIKPKGFYKYALLGFLAFTVLLGPRLAEKMSTLVADESSGIEQDKSAASRMVLINAQLDMFIDSSYFGYGHRGTVFLSPMYIPAEYLAGENGRSSHNTLMSLAVDHGLGGVFYLAIAIVCIGRIRKIPKYSHAPGFDNNPSIMLTGLITALVCFWVAGLGSNNKVIEIDIWLYALIPVLYNMMINHGQKSSNSLVT